MSFMDVTMSAQPVTPEEATESPYVAAYEEGDNPEEESVQHTGLVAYIESEFRRAKDGRRSKEEDWLSFYRNYKGVYGPDTQFTDKEKSRAFIKVTKTKVLAAYAQISDVLFAGDKFPVGIEPRKDPIGVAPEVAYDPKQLTDEKVKEKTGTEYKVPRTYSRPDIEKDLGPIADTVEPVEEQLTDEATGSPSEVTWEPAKIAADAMESKIHDQLAETHAAKHLRMVAFEAPLFGTGVLKGPFAFDKEYPKWEAKKDDEGNPTGKAEYVPEFQTIPKSEARSIWDIYPDPEARSMDEASYVVDRHRMSKHQIRKLKSRPLFRKESIREAVELGPNYMPESWEHEVDQSDTQGKTDRYEVLEFWGLVDVDTLEEADFTIPEELEDEDEVQINAWICNGQILRLALNPFTPSRIPYHMVPYEMDPYSIHGVGVAENMADTQLLMNGFFRMAVDNGALSGNLIIEIDETNLVPGQSMDIYPGKVFRRQAGAPGQAIFGTKFPNVSNELLLLFDKARQLADEATGMPSYSHGQTGVTGVGRTASGMSMLMGASAQNVKAVVRNFDDYLLAPLGKAYFAFNMQFNFDEVYTKGDLEVKARGTESLMQNEVRSQRLMQFMQITANPQMAPMIKYDYILRELAASMDLEEDKILNDKREALIQAKMMAEIQAEMPQPPQAQGQGGPGGQQGTGGQANGPPGVQDPTGTGGGNVAPGAAPKPGAAGFSGGGGGANGGTQSASGPQPSNADSTAQRG